MKKEISIQRRQAYTEILEILKILGSDYSDKIPNKLIEYFYKNSIKDYEFNINFNIDILEVFLLVQWWKRKKWITKKISWKW